MTSSVGSLHCVLVFPCLFFKYSNQPDVCEALVSSSRAGVHASPILILRLTPRPPPDQLTALFEKKMPAYGSYEYAKTADDLGKRVIISFAHSGSRVNPATCRTHFLVAGKTLLFVLENPRSTRGLHCRPRHQRRLRPARAPGQRACPAHPLEALSTLHLGSCL